MCDDFTLMLNKRLMAIIDKYKDVDDSMDVSVDLDTLIVYDHESEESEIEEIPVKLHVKEFNRIYRLKFLVSDFYELYESLFNNL